jgi:hypothetical protein
MEPLGPDARVEPLLDAGEAVLVSCHASRRCSVGAPKPGGLVGDLYLTSRRLLYLGGEPIVADLDRIDEVMLHGDGLVVSTTDGDSILLEVEEPRLLRVQIAAARIARRRCPATEPSASPADR